MEDLVAGRYRVQKTLAVRDAALTRLCTDEQTGRDVVVKTLSMQQAKSHQDVLLFERETKVLRALALPRVPRFVDAITEESGGDVQLHLVQELAPGRTLLAAVKDGRRFTPDDVARIGVALCGTLDALHRLSPPIVHRDVKPANILVEDAGDPWLVDFGAVKTVSGPSKGVTVVGTYGYMAPELYEGRSSPSSDVYALGMTLWFLLSHKEPWEFDDAGGPRAALRDATHVPRGLREALLDATAPDVVQRTPDARAFAAALQGALRGDEARPVVVPAQTRGTVNGKVVLAACAALFIAIFTFAMLRADAPGAVVERPNIPEPAVADPERVARALAPPPRREMLYGDLAAEPPMRCLDRAVHRAFQSRGRYLTWANAAKGPTCKERYVSYGMYSGYMDAIASCKRAADFVPDTEPTLKQATAELAASLAELLPLLETGAKYYDDEDYKDDACAKGQALHPKLIDGWERTRGAVDAVEREVDRLLAARFATSRAAAPGEHAVRTLEVLQSVRALAAVGRGWRDEPKASSEAQLKALEALRAAHQALVDGLAAAPGSDDGLLVPRGIAGLDAYFTNVKKSARAIRETGGRPSSPRDEYSHYDPDGVRASARNLLLHAFDLEGRPR